MKRTIKGSQARFRRPSAVVRPKDERQVQQCVEWALKHKSSLTVIGGGHSDHCVRNHVVAIDMSAFSKCCVFKVEITPDTVHYDYDYDTMAMVGAGCTINDVVRVTMAAGVTVPLGARPSVGAGSWLQGGIGHLGRLYGFSSDSIVGAIMVSLDQAQILCVGHVPVQYSPVNAVYPEDDGSLLWALKGAGTNFGIVISVFFKTHEGVVHKVRRWTAPLGSDPEARRLELQSFDTLVAKGMPNNMSADIFLYSNAEKLHLGVSTIESCPDESFLALDDDDEDDARRLLGKELESTIVDEAGLFQTEFYMSKLLRESGGGKTSSFKRCVFIKDVGAAKVADVLIAATEQIPTRWCYIHLMQGGGKIRQVAPSATAFGCRDWEYACVVTGAWPRDPEDARIETSVVDWVYKVTHSLLPFSVGVYGADLGPDPRDVALVARAFGSNPPRLASLKQRWDPHEILSYTCPLAQLTAEPNLIFIVTGSSGAGKDYCANEWLTMFKNRNLTVQTVSISTQTKREYSEAFGADFSRLLHDRDYKEQHRPMLWNFYQDQVKLNSTLPRDHFLRVVQEAGSVDILLITGMRDEAPVARFASLVSTSRLFEIRVEAQEPTRQQRRTNHPDDQLSNVSDISMGSGSESNSEDYLPSFIFNNDRNGNEAAKGFAERYLFPLLDDDLQKLKSLVRTKPNFPRPGTDFRDILGLIQEDGGLRLCTSLIIKHLYSGWEKIHTIVTCETGGIPFAAALSYEGNKPLALIRKVKKPTSNTVTVEKPISNMSSYAIPGDTDEWLSVTQGSVPRDAPILVVDDVLASGRTLCGILKLLTRDGIDAKNVRILVIAEFPVHEGRQLIRREGFGCCHVQSLSTLR